MGISLIVATVGGTEELRRLLHSLVEQSVPAFEVIVVDQNKDQIYRLRPRANPQAQGWFMCGEGRFGWRYIHHEERLKQPLVRSGGEHVSRDWDEILTERRAALARAAAKRPSGLAAVLSPWMTLEEAYLAAKYLKSRPQIFEISEFISELLPLEMPVIPFAFRIVIANSFPFDDIGKGILDRMRFILAFGNLPYFDLLHGPILVVFFGR